MTANAAPNADYWGFVAQAAADFTVAHRAPDSHMLTGGEHLVRLAHATGTPDGALGLAMYVLMMVAQDAPAEMRGPDGTPDLDRIIEPSTGSPLGVLDLADALAPTKGARAFDLAQGGILGHQRAVPAARTVLAVYSPGGSLDRQAAVNATFDLAGDVDAISAMVTIATAALRSMYARQAA